MTDPNQTADKPASYADQIKTITTQKFHIVDEIDDVETLRKFRAMNPRHSEGRSRIENLDKGHLLVIEDARYSQVTGMLRRIKSATGLKFKAIRNNGKIFVGHDLP